jgi:uncharacterized protein (TIGR02611 family)
MAAKREPPELVKKLRARRHTHRERHPVFRTLWVIAGVTVLAAGAVMVVFPGPALVVIPVGLAMLSLEFRWAERLLERAIDGGLDAKDAVQKASPRQKALGGAALALAVAAVGALAAIVVL